jgi:hypothetical protein
MRPWNCLSWEQWRRSGSFLYFTTVSQLYIFHTRSNGRATACGKKGMEGWWCLNYSAVTCFNKNISLFFLREFTYASHIILKTKRNFSLNSFNRFCFIMDMQSASCRIPFGFWSKPGLLWIRMAKIRSVSPIFGVIRLFDFFRCRCLISEDRHTWVWYRTYILICKGFLQIMESCNL